MSTKLRSMMLSAVLGFGGAVMVSAGTEGRVAGKVVDPDGKPIQGAQVTVTGVGFNYEQVRTTNKKGQFTLLILDGTKQYTIRFEKEGFQPYEEPLKPTLGETLRRAWTLVPGSGAAASATAAPTAIPAKGQVAKLYSEGAEAFAEKDFDKARENFLRVAELAPELPEVHSALAMCYLQMGAHEEAIAAAEQALALKPDELISLEVRYEAAHALGDSEKEMEALRALVEANPGPETARRVFNAGVSKVQAGDLEGAASRFEQAKQMAPELGPAYAALARVYFELGRYDECIANARRASELDPQNAEVLGVLYLALRVQGNLEEADEVFAALRSASPEYVGRVFMDMAISYFNNGDTEEAMEIFERVLEANPDHPKAHYMLGLCYANVGDTGKAKEMLRRFLELAPEDADAASAQEMLATL
jgi:tetratricopeptide (TPR) repeat protein